MVKIHVETFRSLNDCTAFMRRMFEVDNIYDFDVTLEDTNHIILVYLENVRR